MIISCKPKKAIVEQTIESKGATHFIYAKSVFSEMNYSEIQEGTSILLGVVHTDDQLDKVLDYWNYQYYRFFPHNFIPSDSLMNEISLLLDISAKNSNELYENWPVEFSKESYKKLKSNLNISFVQSAPIEQKNKGKYIIAPNVEFWDYQYRKEYNLLIDILSVYERDFEDFEFIHDSEDAAYNYGIIIFDRLCNPRDPDNSAYYSKLIMDQYPNFESPYKEKFKNYESSYIGNLPQLEFNERKSTVDDKKEEYERIIEEKAYEINMLKHLFKSLPIPPFQVIKI